MATYIDYSVASSSQIEKDLCERLERIRLSRNITQAQLAQEAGVSLRTIGRLEKGEGISLDTLIRVFIALGIQRNLASTLPDSTIRPIERVGARQGERQRARPRKSSKPSDTWSWADKRNS